MNFRLIGLFLLGLLVGCEDYYSDPEAYSPEEWFHSTNLKDASFVYNKNSKAMFLDSSGNIKKLEIYDSNGKAVKDIFWNESCEQGDAYLGMVNHYDSGGDHLVYIDNESGEIEVLMNPNFVNVPCSDRYTLGMKLYSLEGTHYFSFDPANTFSTAVASVNLEDEGISVSKSFEIVGGLEREFDQIGDKWFYMITLDSTYDDIDANELVIYSAGGDIEYQESITSAIKINDLNPQFLVRNDTSFSIVEFDGDTWISKPLALAGDSSDLADFNIRPPMELFHSNGRIFLLVDYKYYSEDTLSVYEWSGDELSLISNIEADYLLGAEIYNTELVVSIELDDQVYLSSLNVDSSAQNTIRIEPDKSEWWYNVFSTKEGFLVGESLFSENGISLISHDLKLYSSLENGIQNAEVSTLDSMPYDGYTDYYGFKYYLKFEFSQ